MSLVEEIQSRAINREVSVSDLLRSAKLAASKLKLSETLAWVEHELNGYVDVDEGNIPPYRWTVGTLMEKTNFNPARIVQGNREILEQISVLNFRESVSA